MAGLPWALARTGLNWGSGSVAVGLSSLGSELWPTHTAGAGACRKQAGVGTASRTGPGPRVLRFIPLAEAGPSPDSRLQD